MIHESQLRILAKKISSNFLLEDNLCTNFCFKEKKDKIKASILSDKDQIICGTEVIKNLFLSIFKYKNIDLKIKDGLFARKNEVILTFEENLENLLELKPLVLYFLSRMSAISDLTQKYKSCLENSQTKLSECRFYTPLMKVIEKEATLLMGLHRHARFFRKTVAIEKEHIQCYESLTDLFNKLTESLSPTVRIEVHPSSLEEVKEAASLGVHLIVLKDFDYSAIKMAQRISQNKSYLEITGDLSLEETQRLGNLGVDLVSSDLIIKDSGFSSFSFNISKIS